MLVIVLPNSHTLLRRYMLNGISLIIHTLFAHLLSPTSSTSFTAPDSHLSGSACRTVGINTPEMALYRMESQTPTMLTTVCEPKTGSMWGGMPCQKCSRKLWTCEKLTSHSIHETMQRIVRFEIGRNALPRQNWLEWLCPVSSDNAFCTSWWTLTPVGNVAALMSVDNKLTLFPSRGGKLILVTKTRK